MAITVNKVGHATNDGPLSSIGCTWTGGGSSATNDSIAYFISWFGSATTDITQVVDDTAAVYTQKKVLAFASTGLFGAIYARTSGASATTLTASFGSSVQFVRVQQICITGASTGVVNAVDALYTASATTTANALTSQSGTTATTIDGCIVVGWINNISSAGQSTGTIGTSPLAFTANDAFFNAGDSDSQVLESAIQTTHGTVAANGTSPSAGDSVGVFMIAFAPAGGGTSVALTGQTATSAQGTTVNTTAVPFTGLVGTTGQGFLNVGGSLTSALTGQSVTIAQGSMTPNLTITPNGDVSLALQGMAASGFIGALQPNFAAQLLGTSDTVSEGTLSASSGAVTVALTGKLVTTAEGTLAVSVTTVLVGQGDTVFRGVLTPPGGLILNHSLLLLGVGS